VNPNYPQVNKNIYSLYRLYEMVGSRLVSLHEQVKNKRPVGAFFYRSFSKLALCFSSDLVTSGHLGNLSKLCFSLHDISVLMAQNGFLPLFSLKGLKAFHLCNEQYWTAEMISGTY